MLENLFNPFPLRRERIKVFCCNVVNVVYIHIYPCVYSVHFDYVFAHAYNFYNFTTIRSKVSDGNCLQANSALQLLSTFFNFQDIGLSKLL